MIRPAAALTRPATNRCAELLRAALVVLAVAVVQVAGAAPAAAQNDPVTGFFRFLFGGQRQPETVPQPVPLQPAPSKPKAPAEPKIVEVPKLPNAQVVLVIGDIEARDLANGLQMAFADVPSIAIVNKSRNASGLTRENEGEWSALAPKVLADNKADFIVVMLGVNDKQTIPVAGQKALETGSEAWEQTYRERLRKLVEQIKATGKPFFWVGLPPTADPDLRPSARAEYASFLSNLNTWYKPAVEGAGGQFIDIWNAFADDGGHFTPTGPDVDGQVKRLRSSDGVLFTRAGQRKLAFFVEQEIRKIMRGEMPVEPTTPETTVQPKGDEAMLAAPPPLPPAPWRKVGPVLPLDAGADADGDLAGAPARGPVRETMPGGYPITETPLYRRLVKGEAIDAPTGRVDDFSR